MARDIVDAYEGGKRITVLYNLKDWARIKSEIERVEAELGYTPDISDVLRKLVRDGLPE